MSKEYDPEVIASSFIKQFYEKLSKNPLELHRFYKEESYFTHSDNQQQASAISGIENIRKRVLELNLAGSKVDLSEGSLDAHRSEGNGVIMVATGLFTPADSTESSPFVQTFFLSSQKTASYFVRNSVFRIVGGPVKSNKKTNDSNYNSTDFPIESSDSIEPPETSHPMVDIDYNNQSFIPETETFDQDVSIDDPTDLEPATELVIEDTITYEEPDSEKEANEIEVTESIPHEIIEPQLVPSTANDTVKQVKTDVVVVNQPEPIHVEVPVVNSKPKSFIEALKSKQAAAAAEVASKTKTAPLTTTISPPVQPSNHTIAPQTYVSHLPPVTSNATSRTFKRSSDERVRHSVYVKNVTEKITESDIRALFSQFGDVMNVDIRGQKGFAFVEFETMDMVHRALEHKEALQVGDQLLFIQERTSSVNSKGTTIATPPSNNSSSISSRNHRRSRIPNDTNSNPDNKDKSEQRPRNRHRNLDKNNDINTQDINHNKLNNHRSNNDNNKANKDSAFNEENIKH